MITLLVGTVLVFASGFGVGRVKNAQKLAAVNAEVAKIEGEIKAKLPPGVVTGAISEAAQILARLKGLL